MEQTKEAEALGRLVEIMRTLRSPEGCLWDRKQKREDIARYLLEEAYEVVDALEKGSPAALKEELGDLLFQIIFVSTMAEEEGDFDLTGVMKAIGEKMIRRHPHVFGDVTVRDVRDIKDNWDLIKDKEKAGETRAERFAGIAKDLPALLRAQKITKEAAKAGFDWEKTADVMEKVAEEWQELKESVQTGRREKICEEMGDILFSLVNLCRFLDMDAEAALRGTVRKFIARFSFMEDRLRSEGKNIEDVSFAELDGLWDEAKRETMEG